MGNATIIDSSSKHWISVREYLVILYIMLKVFICGMSGVLGLLNFVIFARGLRLSCRCGLHVRCESSELGLDCRGLGKGWLTY